MSKPKLPTWVFLVKANEIRCARCGKHEKMEEDSLPFEAYIRWMEYAALKHSHCQEQEGTLFEGADKITSR